METVIDCSRLRVARRGGQLEDEKDRRFRYSMEFELALAVTLGHRFLGKASMAADGKFVRRSMLKVIEKWRQRIRNISAMDERLDARTASCLNQLESAVKVMSDSVNNDWLIISSLAELVSRLLGYDWVDGEIHRHVIYFRDKKQEDFDFTMLLEPRNGLEIYNALGRTLRAKYAVIDHLKNRAGLTVNEVATIMGLNDYFVNKVLHRIEQFEINEGRQFSDISNFENTP